MNQAKLLTGIVAVVLLLATRLPAAELVVTDPWIREAPPGAKALVAYMAISNPSAQAVTVEAVSSAAFAKIVIHQMSNHDGLAHMTKMGHLRLGPGDRIDLAPGGYHLMLIEPTRPLMAGDQVELQFQLDDGTAMTVTAVVRR